MGLFKDKPLKNKVAIVTGGTKGIGLAIADKLASLGAKVIVSAIHEEKTKHWFIHCDVSSSSDVMNVISQVIKKYKRIDILINNAGIFPNVPFKDMTEEQWDKVIDVNLKGTFLFTKAATPYMIMQKYGKIVNISSIASVLGYAGLSHYCASKGGVSAFTRAVAVELAQYNIRVNAIAPGMIITPGVQENMNEEGLKQYEKGIPKGKAGMPNDIAELAAFLVSDASENILGQTIISDGGNVLI